MNEQGISVKKQKHTRWIILAVIVVVLSIAISVGIVAVKQNLPLLKPGKIHVACVGDSITYGLGLSDESREEQSYPARLEQLLGEDYQVLNYGLSGRTLMDEGDRPYRKETFYGASVWARADVYIVMLGTNDSKSFNWTEGSAERYREELTTFLKAYQDLPNKPAVYVMQPPWAFPQDDTGEIKADVSDDTIRKEICPIIQEVGDDLGITVIDLYSLTEQHPEWYADGLHPNAEGYEQIAAYIYNTISIDDMYSDN